MISKISGSFLEGYGMIVYLAETDNYHHVLVHKEKNSNRLFVEIRDKKYYQEDFL